MLLKASCRWSGAAAIILTKMVSAGSARAGACWVAHALSAMRRDWPISTIRAVCSRCWKSMKMMRSWYCSRASRSGSAKSGRSVAQNAAVVGIAAGGFARLRRGCPGWQSAGPLRIQCQRRPAARHRPRRRGQTQLRL